MTNFCIFTASQASNRILCLITSLFMFPLKNITSSRFSSLFSHEFDLIKENRTFTFLICNTTLHIYSPITLSHYIFQYQYLSSGVPTALSLAQPSFLLSVSRHFLVNSFLRSRTLHYTMQRQEHSSDTHHDRDADLELSGQKLSCQFHSPLHNVLCNAEVDNELLIYADASSLLTQELMNLSLSISLYP